MKHNAKSRHGIALIIVLAFLTVLVLMAVTFTALMRTERVASRNYADTVRARQLVHTGLARAMDDLAQEQMDDIRGPLFPPRSERDPSGVNGTFWTNQSFFSYGELGTNKQIHVAGSTSLRPYFPHGDETWTLLTNQIVRDTAANNYRVLWDPVIDPLDTNLVVGRISYWVFDCSGLLDAEKIHQLASPRARGVDPAEIRLGPDLFGINNPDRLDQNRTRHRRFASIRELVDLGPSEGFLSNNVSHVQNLINFSHTPSGYWDGTEAKEPIFVGTADQILSNQQGLEDVLSGDPYNLDPADRLYFIANLIDYVDDDRTPGGGLLSLENALESFSTEPVAMVNEISITNDFILRESVSNGSTNYIFGNRVDVGVEVWYPFPAVDDTEDYVINVQFSRGWNAFTVAPNLQHTFEGPWPGGNNGLRVAGPFRAVQQVTVSDTNAPPPLPSLIELIVTVERAGQVVDRSTLRANWGSVTNFLSRYPSLSEGSSTATNRSVFSYECIDPRMNWRADNTDYWTITETPSMNAINAAATARYSEAGRDGTWQMHVANSAPDNTGEMGFLLFSRTEPWKTVPLFGAEAWPVWKHFTAIQAPPLRGRVSAATAHTDVLAALFHEIPIETFPGSGGGGSVTWAQARVLADTLLAIPSTNRLDAGVLTQLTPPGANLLEQKSVLRHAGDLISSRQQVFTIVVEAELLADLEWERFRHFPSTTRPYRAVEDHEILARQKALAVIWRDPFGEEPTFTQFFEWLTD